MDQIINNFVDFFSREENRYIAIIAGLVAVVVLYKVASILIKLFALVVVVSVILFFAYPYVENSASSVNSGISHSASGLSSAKNKIIQEKDKAKKEILKPSERAGQLYDSAVNMIDNALSKLKSTK